ncbi:Prolyl oligopeptidase family protein [Poriferisphaera corsica]|uniref:Prolyl oligopeptidase family protein n=1 Tax=Poriferisphaera corsica TaxID=2528020 RepID=A0A517YUG3_9BACT|nr:prolyl oligopeptidase family serine peptidase [Poriferisphaera corsica]QDU33846.1 Prolyl oligopeptidase family protein [Poriferisphaera corsica]
MHTLKYHHQSLKTIGLLMLLLVLQSCAASPVTDGKIIKPTNPQPVSKGTIYTSPDGLRYLVYTPRGYERSSEKAPLLLFLHGAEQRGNSFDMLRTVGPNIAYETGSLELPFILIAPQLEDNEAWNPRELSNLLDEVESNYRTDSSRIYVTGMSMGGYGTWILAGKTPERFAAIAPISSHAYVEQSLAVRQVTSWVFHGQHDPLVSVNEAIDMVKAIKALGGNTHLTIYEDADHDAWTRTYAASEFYEWLLDNKLQNESTQTK